MNFNPPSTIYEILALYFEARIDTKNVQGVPFPPNYSVKQTLSLLFTLFRNVHSTGTCVSLYYIHCRYVLVFISYVARCAYVLELALIASTLSLPKETNEHVQLYEQGGSSLKRGVKGRGEIAK